MSDLREKHSEKVKVIHFGDDEMYHLIRNASLVDEDMTDEELAEFVIDMIFDSDPDKINIYGYESYCAQINNHVIVYGDLDESELQLVSDFYNEGFQDKFFHVENTWENYEDDRYINIAYRGGKGYVYTIWRKKT